MMVCLRTGMRLSIVVVVAGFAAACQPSEPAAEAPAPEAAAPAAPEVAPAPEAAPAPDAAPPAPESLLPDTE